MKDVTFFDIDGHAPHDRLVRQVVNGSLEDESIIVVVGIVSKLDDEF